MHNACGESLEVTGSVTVRFIGYDFLSIFNKIIRRRIFNLSWDKHAISRKCEFSSTKQTHRLLVCAVIVYPFDRTPAHDGGRDIHTDRQTQHIYRDRNLLHTKWLT